MTVAARPLFRLTAATAVLLGAMTFMALPSVAQDGASPDVTIDQRRDAAMQACLGAGTAADECDCGMAYLRANLNEADEAFVLEILASLPSMTPDAFAESKGMSEAELNNEILRLQPTLADLASICG